MTLSNDQIRVKVAELCGYKRVPDLTRRDQWVKDGCHYQLLCNGHEMSAGITYLPNYPLSLDACAEGFLNNLTDDQAHKMNEILYDDPTVKNMFRPSARSLCLAFIQTMENHQ